MIGNPRLNAQGILSFKNISPGDKSITITGYKIISSSEDSNFNSIIDINDTIVPAGGTHIISIPAFPPEQKVTIQLITDQNEYISIGSIQNIPEELQDIPVPEPEPLGPLYLYNEGEGEGDWVVGYTSSCGSTTKEETYLYLSANSGMSTECTYVTDNAIDLTDYNTLYVEWDTDDDDKHTSNLDISSFDGEYYIRTHHYGFVVIEFPWRVSFIGISALKNGSHATLEVDGYINSDSNPPVDSLKVYKVWLE